MTRNDDIKDIRDIVEKIQVDLAIVKTNLENHLKHTIEEKDWIKFIIPTALTILNLILAYKLFSIPT